MACSRVLQACSSFSGIAENAASVSMSGALRHPSVGCRTVVPANALQQRRNRPLLPGRHSLTCLNVLLVAGNRSPWRRRRARSPGRGSGRALRCRFSGSGLGDTRATPHDRPAVLPHDLVDPDLTAGVDGALPPGRGQAWWSSQVRPSLTTIKAFPGPEATSLLCRIGFSGASTHGPAGLSRTA